MPDIETVESEDRGVPVWVPLAIAVTAIGLLIPALLFAVESLLEADLGISSGEGAVADTATTYTPAAQQTTDAPSVSFEDFASREGMTLVGSAEFAENAISLTRKASGSWQYGAAWYPEPLEVANGFEAAFAFQIDHVSWFTIGHGFAFVIQGSASDALGDPGGSGGPGYRSIPNSVAVEFDTVHQDYLGDQPTPMPPTSEDPPGLLANHVAVHTNGRDANTSHSRHSIAHSGLPILLADRQVHAILVRYRDELLTVYVDEFADPVLETNFDIGTLNLSQGRAYVGFTAGTDPGFYADHRILAWLFNSPCLTTDCGP